MLRVCFLYNRNCFDRNEDIVILGMYLTMSPLIASGVANMIFTKTKMYKEHKSPIDGGKKLKDGNRVLGDNKTWLGFFSMILFSMIFQVICGVICNVFSWNSSNDFYISNPNVLSLNIVFGFFIGFAYMIFELPNSFIKRRLNIKPGQHGKGFTGKLFFVIDQFDSMIGVMLVLYLFTDISFLKMLGYIFVGAFTHLFINVVLRFLKVRKNL